MASDKTSIEKKGVNFIFDCLNCPDNNKTLFDANNLKAVDKVPVDDGYIKIMEPDGIDSEFGYILNCQIKTTTKMAAVWIDNKLKKGAKDEFNAYAHDTPPYYHLNDYARKGESFIIFYVFLAKDDPNKKIAFWVWKTREEWLELYYKRKKECLNSGDNFGEQYYKASISTENILTLSNRNQFYKAILPRVKAAYKALEHPQIAPQISKERESLQDRFSKEQMMKNYIDDLENSEKKTDKIYLISRILDFAQESKDVDLNKLINKLSPSDLSILLSQVNNSKIDIVSEHFELITTISDLFSVDQEYSDTDTKQIDEQGYNWIQVKWSYILVLRKYYEQASDSQKREIEITVWKMFWLTSFKPLQNLTFTSFLYSNFENIPQSDEFYEQLVTLAESDSYIKLQIPELLVKYREQFDKIKALEVIDILINSKKVKPEYVATGLMQSWRGTEGEYDDAQDEIYNFLCLTVPLVFHPNDIWLKIVLEGLTRSYNSSLDKFIIFGFDDSETDDLKPLLSENKILDGFLDDNYTFGFNKHAISGNFDKVPVKYKWFRLLKLYVESLSSLDRKAFTESLLNDENLKRESVYFTIYRTYIENNWTLPVKLDEFLIAYTDYEKNILEAKFKDRKDLDEFLNEFSIQDEWSKEWIGMSEIQTIDGDYDTISRFINKNPDLQDYLSFDVEKWCKLVVEQQQRFFDPNDSYPFDKTHDLQRIVEDFAEKHPEKSLQILEKLGDLYNGKNDDQSHYIFRIIYSWVHGILQSRYIDKFNFTLDIGKKPYFKNDLAQSVISYWRNIIQEESNGFGEAVLVKIRKALIDYLSVENVDNYGVDRPRSRDNISSGHALIELLINSNIGQAWILLGNSLYNKLGEEEKKETIALMEKHLENNSPLIVECILYCFQYNEISPELWDKKGLLYKVFSRIFERHEYLENGTCEFALKIYTRIINSRWNDDFNEQFNEYTNQLFTDKVLINERTALVYILSLYVYHGKFKETIELFVYQNKDPLISTVLLSVLSDNAGQFRQIIQEQEDFDDPFVKNPVKAKLRLKNLLLHLSKWQNEYFEKRHNNIHNKNEPVKLITFNQFFRDMEIATSAEDIRRIYEFWGEEIYKSIFSTPYEYFINILRGHSTFDILEKLKVDDILLNFLEMICGNQRFIQALHQYSLDSLTEPLSYLINSTNDDKKSETVKKIQFCVDELSVSQGHTKYLTELIKLFKEKFE